VLFKPVEGAASGGCHAEIYLPKKGALGPSKTGKKAWPVGELDLPSLRPLLSSLDSQSLEASTGFLRSDYITLFFL